MFGEKLFHTTACALLLLIFCLPAACGDDDDDDPQASTDPADDDTDDEISTEERCVAAMERLFGAEGCAQPDLYTSEDMIGVCGQDAGVVAGSECLEAAFEEVVRCMEVLDCADATESIYDWTDCRIEFDRAAKECPTPDS